MTSARDPMSLIECLSVLKESREDEVIVTSMGNAREWISLGSPHPLDWNYVPSSMGQATSLGLGIAMARPDRKVVVCIGDGSLLMNLGSLVTISAEQPENLILLVFDNGVYEVTGQQSTPATSPGRTPETEIDFGSIARSCGFSSVTVFEGIKSWQMGVRQILSQQGPSVAVLRVAPISGAAPPKSPGPGPKRAVQFADALKKF